MTDLIDRQALLEKMRRLEASAAAGEKRDKDDTEWPIIRECYGDMVRLVTEAPSALAIATVSDVRAQTSTPEPEEGETMWRNHYVCPECKSEWTDEWSCQCDDDCRDCGARHISPTKSEEVK